MKNKDYIIKDIENKSSLDIIIKELLDFIKEELSKNEIETINKGKVKEVNKEDVTFNNIESNIINIFYILLNMSIKFITLKEYTLGLGLGLCLE